MQTKNGGTERSFNDRHRVYIRNERKREGTEKKRLQKAGKETSDRERCRKSEGVPETDVTLAGLGRMIASGPFPCQALTPPSSAVIYRLRFARFKQYSVVIMAREGRTTFLGWEQN